VHVLYYPAVSSERDHDFAIVSPSRFLCFFVFLPPKNEMNKGPRSWAGRWVRNKRKRSQEGWQLSFDFWRRSNRSTENRAWWVLNWCVCCLYWGGTSRNAKTWLQTSDATRWKSGRLLVKLCEDALVICSTLLFFSKICVIHSFRAYRQSRIPTGIFICFEFIFLMSHIFVGDGVHPFGSPLIFFNHNDLKREPNRKRKKTLKESRDSRYTFRLI
jgi:hypothetical protein